MKAKTTTAKPQQNTNTFQGEIPATQGSAPAQVMTATQARFMTSMPDSYADGVLYQLLSEQVYSKLAYNRGQGRHGWHTNNVSSKELKKMLVGLVLKGDYIDVAIVAGMLLMREQMLMVD